MSDVLQSDEKHDMVMENCKQQKIAIRRRVTKKIMLLYTDTWIS